MNWILIVFIFTGERHGMQTQEFKTQIECEQAAMWISLNTKSQWSKNWRPTVKCFNKGS